MKLTKALYKCTYYTYICVLYGLVYVSEILGKILELFDKFRIDSILIGLIQAYLILFIYCAVRALIHATAHTHTDSNTGRPECDIKYAVFV